MAIKVNLRHLEEARASVLKGELPVAELDLDSRDEMILADSRWATIWKCSDGEGLLVQGRFYLPLDCECVRCLKPFQYGA